MNTGWEHPLDASEGWEGLNDGDMEHFVSDPIVKAAREGIQNSLDAKNTNNYDPVIVTFRLLEVNVSDIPNHEELSLNIKSALESQKYHKENDEGTTAANTIKTYEDALNLLDGDTVSIFQIEDSNSTGMVWNEGKQSPFFNYIKARSYSSKSEDALGAFGIGKLAPFVVSDLRTVFASSVYQIGDSIYQSTQGKSKLSSLFDDNSNSKTQRIAIGYWGDKNGYNPVRDLDSSNFEWIQKSHSKMPNLNDIGTVISTLGFNGNSDGLWNYWIVEAVLMNFFQAILNNNLKVIVEGINSKDNFTINNKSLDMFFDAEGQFAQKIKKAREPDGQNWEKNFRCTHQYLELLNNEDVVYPLKLSTLGYCELRLKVSDGLPKKICYLREGMKISETLDAPGVRNFSDLKDFVAVFECKDAKGNRLLRAMENPAHNSWDPERPQDLNSKTNAKRALNEIGTEIRKILNASAKNEAKKVKDIDLMIQYGFVFEGDDQKSDDDSEINPFKAPVKIEMTEVKTPQPVTRKPGNKGSNNGEGEGKKTNKTNNNNNNRSGNEGASSYDPQVSNFRSVRGKTSNSISIFFTPEFSGNAYLYLYKSQADGRSEKYLRIDKWDEEAISKNSLSKNYIKGQRESLNLELAENFDGSLEIVLLAKQEE